MTGRLTEDAAAEVRCQWEEFLVMIDEAWTAAHRIQYGVERESAEWIDLGGEG
jgi:hypothetical protein